MFWRRKRTRDGIVCISLRWHEKVPVGEEIIKGAAKGLFLGKIKLFEFTGSNWGVGRCKWILNVQYMANDVETLLK